MSRNSDQLKREILEMLPKLETDPAWASAVVTGVDRSVAISRGRALGIELPPELLEWFEVSGGYPGTHGAIYGMGDFARLTDFMSWNKQFENWLESGGEKNLLPVGSDGCGNQYVMAVGHQGKNPIGFVEALSDNPRGVQYYVASDFWHFAWVWLKAELKVKVDWSSKKAIFEIDPELKQFSPLIWADGEGGPDPA